jgi:hypothetical protein
MRHGRKGTAGPSASLGMTKVEGSAYLSSRSRGWTEPLVIATAWRAASLDGKKDSVSPLALLKVGRAQQQPGDHRGLLVRRRRYRRRQIHHLNECRPDGYRSRLLGARLGWL